jgi:cytochrome c oxidase cbb3-type subunit 1
MTGFEFPRPGLVRAHFRLALAGVLFEVVPIAIAGVVEGFKLRDAGTGFDAVAKATLPFLRVSTVGILLIGLGHVLFFINLAGLANRYFRVRAVSAYAEATVDLLKPVEAKQ